MTGSNDKLTNELSVDMEVEDDSAQDSARNVVSSNDESNLALTIIKLWVFLQYIYSLVLNWLLTFASAIVAAMVSADDSSPSGKGEDDGLRIAAIVLVYLSIASDMLVFAWRVTWLSLKDEEENFGIIEWFLYLCTIAIAIIYGLFSFAGAGFALASVGFFHDVNSRTRAVLTALAPIVSAYGMELSSKLLKRAYKKNPTTIRTAFFSLEQFIEGKKAEQAPHEVTASDTFNEDGTTVSPTSQSNDEKQIKRESNRFFSSMPKLANIKNGILDSIEVKFEIHKTRGDGNCGFYALPIGHDRAGVCEKLRSYADKPHIRKLVAPEIREILIAGVMPRAADNYAYCQDLFDTQTRLEQGGADKQQELDAHLANINTYCESEEAFENFVLYCLGSNERLAYYPQKELTSSLDAIAEVMEWRVYIYQENELGRLEQCKVLGPEKGTPVYLYHVHGQDTHYELMSIYEEEFINSSTRNSKRSL